METEVTDRLRESEFYYNQGHAHKNAGNLDLAISCFEESAKIGHPYFKAISLFNLAGIYGQIGETEKQVEQFKRIAGLSEEEKKFLPNSLLGTVLERVGDYNAAAEVLARAIRLKPTDVATLLNLAELEIIRGKYDVALELLKKASASTDPKIILFSKFFSIVVLALQKRNRELSLALTEFVSAVQSQGIPGDLHWDFSDIAPVLTKIDDPHLSGIIQGLVNLLNRRITAERFLQDFVEFLPAK